MSYYMHDITWPEFQAKKRFGSNFTDWSDGAACTASSALYRCKNCRKIFILSGKRIRWNYHADVNLWI